LLINWFLTPKDTADYSFAVQLDAGMLLLASAVWTVLYPRASRAVVARDVTLLRRYFWRGTVLTFAALVAVSGLLLLCIKPVLLVWLRTDVPGTRAILPLLLVHTVIGGSTAAIRAILFAAGKARVFAISAVIAGVFNVIVSFVLVRYTGLGLVGVVLGTLSAVILRCGVFLPWYTLRTLRELPTPSPADLPAEQTAMDEPL
jgi:O-antigen/teichoic acid export membrane protein